MEKPKNNRNLSVYLPSVVILVLLWFVLKWTLPAENFFHTFMFNGWYVQFLNSWLFIVGMLFWLERYSFFKTEKTVFEKINMPEFSINMQKADELQNKIPAEHRQTLSLRRFSEILQAFCYGEDLIRLNAELSHRDSAEVERGHLILNILISIIPVVGFLGTVIGLSLGMIKFPEVTDILTLKTGLKDFAASLSIAFNTTLLGLVYTIITILMVAFLRQREEALVGEVDTRARRLISKLKIGASQGEGQKDTMEKSLTEIKNALVNIHEVFSQALNKMAEGLLEQNAKLISTAGESIEKMGKVVAQNIKELKDDLRRPPCYKIVVQPMEVIKDE